MPLPDYYKVLGVAQAATAAEIRKAYRQLALVHHPDKKATGDNIDADEFRQVHEAYKILADVTAREKYDQRRSRDLDASYKERRRAAKAEEAARVKAEKQARRRAEAKVFQAESEKRNDETNEMIKKRKAARRAAEKKLAAEKKRAAEEARTARAT
jgi:DnaJ-class molecular chaperone